MKSVILLGIPSCVLLGSDGERTVHEVTKLLGFFSSLKNHPLLLWLTLNVFLIVFCKGKTYHIRPQKPFKNPVFFHVFNVLRVKLPKQFCGRSWNTWAPVVVVSVLVAENGLIGECHCQHLLGRGNSEKQLQKPRYLCIYTFIWVFPKIGAPQKGWFYRKPYKNGESSPPKFNSSPLKHGWLEDKPFLLGWYIFGCELSNFQGVYTCVCLRWLFTDSTIRFSFFSKHLKQN